MIILLLLMADKDYNVFFTKDFIYTSDSKIFVEHNCIENDEKSLTNGMIFLPPNPEWEGAENNKIFNELFYMFKNDFSLMKCLFQKYQLDGFQNRNIINKNSYKSLLYVRDSSVVVDFFFQKFKNIRKCFVIGYSWGCQMAMNVIMRRPEITDFILISPTICLKDCDYKDFIISNFKTNGYIIHGTNDAITPVSVVEEYTNFLRSKKMKVCLDFINTNHYYNTPNAIQNLYEKILYFITNHTNNGTL